MEFAMLAGMGIGAVLEGVSISQKKCELQNQVKNVKENLKNLNLSMKQQDTLLQLQEVELRQKVDDLNMQIAAQHRLMVKTHADFKSSYQQFQVGGIIFLILLMFSLALRRFVFPRMGGV